MRTEHKVFYSDSRKMSKVKDGTVDLVITSPPYPMVQMWDGAFSSMSDMVKETLAAEEGKAAFTAMHDVLDRVWSEVDRTLRPGGTVCINVGDAARKIGNSFELYPNHSRIIQTFQYMGYKNLPMIIWRKTTNKPNKFMGSGMLPPNAYVTLEHEFILIFRKPGTRSYSEPRGKSAYFWEERNAWFSDVWSDIRGTFQSLEKGTRQRSGAYPTEIPYRLINMYSVMGDTILDPFLGTGTTTLAAIASGRNSVGFEFDKGMKEVIDDRMSKAKTYSRKIVWSRKKAHKKFVEAREEDGKKLKYHSPTEGQKVMTKQEMNMDLPIVDLVEATKTGYEAHYEIEKTKWTLETRR